MAKLRYGVSYWVDRFPRSRRPSYPRQRGILRTDVAIVGGGLTGCTIAWAFASAGMEVALLEADRIGLGSGTAGSVGVLRQELDVDFQRVTAIYGLRAARSLWQDSRRASLDFAAALRRLDVRCDIGQQDAIWFTRRRDAEKRLRKEHKTRREAGVTLDGLSWLTAAGLRRETAIVGVAGLRSRAVGVLDPYRACVGLAAAAVRKHALVFEKTPVERVRLGRRAVDIRTAGGSVRAARIVLATDYPPADLWSLRRHFKLVHSYAVVTERLTPAMRREVGRRAVLLRDTDDPPRALRWLRDDQILFTGADQAAVSRQARAKTIVQRAGQLMYELSTLYPVISGIPAAYAWDAVQARPVDGLPYIGPHRNYPRHLFAMGGSRQGAGFAYLAAKILLRAHRDAPERGDELFAFTRTF